MGSLSNQQSQRDDHTSMEQVAVIMVPFAAQGHLNQMMQLSCLISSYGLPVFYVSSAIHTRQARVRVNGLNPLDMAKIHFHDIPVPPFASPPPDPNSSSKFPEQLQPAWDASLSLRQPFAEYLREMSEKFKRVVVVHDPMTAAVVQDVNSIHNAESYAFNCIPAFSQAFFIGEGLLDSSAEHLKELDSLQEYIPEKVLEFVAMQTEPLKYRAGDLYNTCRLIEAPYLDLLEKEESGGNRKSWAIGPILPTKLSSAAKPANKCLEWLDQQEPNSVIYVSFGTTVSLSDEQIKELALGLEQSKVKFLWVLRDADKGDIFDGQVRRAELPEGFEERVKEVGMVHYYGSAYSSLANAFRPTKKHHVRNTSSEDGDCCYGMGKRMELVKASAIENAVRRLMASEEGDEIRKTAAELAATLRQATEPGGASRLELDSFVAHITR
ncbi:UNVERIFIED_CONTAM: Zeatin O-xylosyltransferase [Sesamum angustifolium]|uniref:Zeatin O-xylosyltransferase n=1 Tax=Sesamum angustifolium TaxID=2727405 RepID=A0AAW2MU93_9LAMI